MDSAHSLPAGLAYCKPDKKPRGKQKRSPQPLGKRVRKNRLLSGCRCPAGPSSGGELLRGLVQSTQPRTDPGDTSAEPSLARDTCEPPKGSGSQRGERPRRAPLRAHRGRAAEELLPGDRLGDEDTRAGRTPLLPQESQGPSHTHHCRPAWPLHASAWLTAAFPQTARWEPSLNTSQRPLELSLL